MHVAGIDLVAGAVLDLKAGETRFEGFGEVAGDLRGGGDRRIGGGAGGFEMGMGEGVGNAGKGEQAGDERAANGLGHGRLRQSGTGIGVRGGGQPIRGGAREA